MAHGRQQDELQDITLLGNQDNTYNFDYRPDVLESFDNKHQGRDYFVKIQLSRIYIIMSNYWATRFCNYLYFIYSKC